LGRAWELTRLARETSTPVHKRRSSRSVSEGSKSRRGRAGAEEAAGGGREGRRVTAAETKELS
jgi:hypothetical protein